MDQLTEAIRAGDATRLRSALAKEPAKARKPQYVVDAARIADLAAVELLVAHGADVNAIARGYRALHALIQERPHKEAQPTNERLACFDWLLAHGADPEQLGAWPPARAVVIAAFAGLEPFVERLRAVGARIDGFASCALADVAAIKRELKRDRGFANSRDGDSLTALQCCVGARIGHADPKLRKRRLEIATLLLDAGADPNAQTRSWSHDVDAAYFAVSAHNAELFELLLERGVDATAALPAAAWQDTDEYCEIALRHGARIDAARAEGRPLLNELVRWGQVRPVLWLVAHGADPNLPDDKGWTAMHQAAARGNERMFKALLAAGGNPRRAAELGRTPVGIAKAKGRAKLVELAKATES